RVNRDVADFPGKTRSACPQLAVENDRAADAFSDHHVEKIAAADTRAGFEFSVSLGVGVVFDLHAQTGRARQFTMKILDKRRWNIAWRDDAVRLTIDQSGDCDA